MNPSHILAFFKREMNTHLDIGCNIGSLMKSALDFGVKESHGIEINQAALQVAKEKYATEKNLSFYHASADVLPFESNKFDIVTASEVLEHVPSELRQKVIKEVSRCLKEKGTFVFTVPHQGIFAFLDPSNFRFYFPKLFHYFNHLLKGPNRDAGFVGEKHGVVFHHHFTTQELRELLQADFRIQSIRYRGFVLAPIIEWLCFPLYRLKLTEGLLFRALKKVQQLEYQINFGQWLGYNVLIEAKKK